LKTWSDFNISVPNRGGAERYTVCPQCSHERKKQNQKKPCLSVNVDEGIWFCHHCNWSGTLKQGVDRGKYTPTWDKPEFIKPRYDEQMGLTEQTIQYFAKRGITQDVLQRNRITTGRVFMPQVDDWVNAIQFPFLRDGQVVNTKYRDHQKNFRLEGRAEIILYGLDDIGELTVIVEGEIDKLSLEMAGISYCVSVPHGAPSPKSRDYSSKFDFLERCKNELEKVEQFVIAVDSDPPGRRLEEELVHRLGKHRCAIVRWPAGIKDANEMLLKYGPDELANLIYNAEPPPIEGVVRVRDIASRMERFYENGGEPGFEFPDMPTFSQHYKVALGEWTVVTGIPGHGKSEFLDYLVMSLCVHHDWVVGIYSPENDGLEQHISKLLEKHVRKPFRSPDGYGFDGVSRMGPQERQAGEWWLDQHFLFLDIEQEDNMTLDRILELTKEMIFQHGLKGLIIDPWNEVEHERPAHLTETEYTAKCLSKIKNFVKRNRIHIWVVAHPTKMQKITKGDKEMYPVPRLYDISGSSNWYNKAFNGLSVWRDATTNDPVQVHVQKIKQKKNGKVGMVRFNYDTLTGRYTEVKPINIF
jgi:twinkle protein